MFARFRKRPVIIDACKVADLMNVDIDSVVELPAWFTHALRMGEVYRVDDGFFCETLEGCVRAGKGDWIIRGVEGEFYPCADRIFKKTYEPVTEEDDCD